MQLPFLSIAAKIVDLGCVNPQIFIMQVQHQQHDRGGKFYVLVDGAEAAEMTYVNTGPGTIIIDHTGVDDILAGKGVGKQLIAASVAWARKENISIIPLCPFAKAIFDKVPAYADVLKK